jgi:hypothetical protein
MEPLSEVSLLTYSYPSVSLLSLYSGSVALAPAVCDVVLSPPWSSEKVDKR